MSARRWPGKFSDPKLWARVAQNTSGLPRKHTSVEEWKIAVYTMGAAEAGRCPGWPRGESVTTNGTNQLPAAPMIFGGSGPESHERYEERQRQRRVDAILKKHGIGQKPGPWWRI